MISVCVPTYNGERFLSAQLESILRSPLVAEVLISDDGSTDGTRDVVLAFADQRIRLLNGPNAGLVKNYEFLLGRAQGDQIFLADQDDVWLPEKVETISRSLAEADLVLSDCMVVDDQLHCLHPSFFKLHQSGPGLLRNLARNSFLGCCMALDRGLLRYALPFPDGIPMHDWWLGLVAEAFGRVRFIDQRLIMYRRHGGNASTTAEPSRATWATRVRWRTTLAAALAARMLSRGRPVALANRP